MATEIEEDERKRLVSVWNEQQKLAATFCNQLAAALFAVGAVAPYIGTFVTKQIDNLPAASISAVLCTAVAIGIHLYGRFTLGAMK